LAASANPTNTPCSGWTSFLYYYTNFGVQHVLNFNAGTILLGFMLYRLGVDIQFKISVFFGSDNPYHSLWIMLAAKLFSRDDGSSRCADSMVELDQQRNHGIDGPIPEGAGL